MPHLTRSLRNALHASAATVVAVAFGLIAAVQPVAAAPFPPDFGSRIDAYADYDGQAVCDPTDKPGVLAFRSLVASTYPGVNSTGISRDCAIGGRSEHKEGRAWDYGLDASDPTEKARADELLNWLLASDCYGNKHAMARRLGMMYIIWNRRIFSFYAPERGWVAYTGANPHIDHIHFSFAWAGALRQSSFWTAARVSPSPCLQLVGTPTTTGKFIDALYADFLGRAADAQGRAYWINQVMSGATSRQQVSFKMATTDEWLNRVITEMYADTLGRAPDPGGLAHWRGILRGGTPVAVVAANFYASQEYFLRSGGNVDGWLTAMYAALLERRIDPGGLASWRAATATYGRVAVAEGFYQSQETLVRRVASLYVALLGRGPDPAGLVTWPGIVRTRGDLELASFLASSEEYFLRAQIR